MRKWRLFLNVPSGSLSNSQLVLYLTLTFPFILGAEINAALMKYRVKHLILDRMRGVKKPPVEEASMEDEAIAREQGANAGR